MHNAREIVRYPLPVAMVATMVFIGAVDTPLWVIPLGTLGFLVTCMPAFRPMLIQAKATGSVTVKTIVWAGAVGMALIFTAITYLLGSAIGDYLRN